MQSRAITEATSPALAVSTSGIDVVGLISQRFNAMMERKEAQLMQMQMQTQLLTQLIEMLQHSKSD
ncbi:hypothetical protein GN958_ATG04298 [Phytophthora infestans]|uniref:Uncharacterized protein n=1 Tax=Phytophthora infestans TaxID=4787 RepID=A0A8S9UZP9_PHYIN|nr:hypothetical protein GN958_ATG04298 [Phytophthora infestans]